MQQLARSEIYRKFTHNEARRSHPETLLTLVIITLKFIKTKNKKHLAGLELYALTNKLLRFTIPPNSREQSDYMPKH
eukprot:4901547-Amphidinium_carterae.1